jgi:hypothetical protein
MMISMRDIRTTGSLIWEQSAEANHAARRLLFQDVSTNFDSGHHRRVLRQCWVMLEFDGLCNGHRVQTRYRIVNFHR